MRSPEPDSSQRATPWPLELLQIEAKAARERQGTRTDLGETFRKTKPADPP